MCRAQTGPRCSKYAEETLAVVFRRHEKSVAELEAYEEKFADSLAKEEDLTKSDEIHQHKHQRLVETVEEQSQKLSQAEFEYFTTPSGQKKLEEEIAAATAEGDSERAAAASAALDHAKTYRQWQLDSAKELKTIEEESGPEASETEALSRIEALEEEQAAHAAEGQRLEAEIEDLKKENAENEEAIEEIEKTAEELEEEAKVKAAEELKIRKARQRRLIILLSAALSAYLIYTLTMRLFTGKQSQLMQYAKSAGTRKAIQLGQNSLVKNFSKKPEKDEKKPEKG